MNNLPHGSKARATPEISPAPGVGTLDVFPRGRSSRRRRLCLAALAAALVAAAVGPILAAGSKPPKLISSVAAYGATSLPTAPTGRTFVTPKSIAADCSANVTGALNSWIASVPDNSTLLFLSGGCYDVEGVLVISGKHAVAFMGNGAQLLSKSNGSHLPPQYIVGDGGIAQAWPASRQHVLIMNSSDVTVKRLIVHGGAPNNSFVPAYANQNGFDIRSDSRVLIDGVKADHVYGDLVAVTQGSRNVTVQNSTFKTSGRNCMSVYWGNYVTFQNNTMADCHFVNFDIEPIHPAGDVWWTAEHILITHNDVTGSRFFSNEGNLASPTNYIEVSYNSAHGIPLTVLVGGGSGDPTVIRHHYRIIGNTSDMVAGVAFRGLMTITSVQGLLVQGNTQNFQYPLPKGQSTVALVVSHSSELVVNGNAFNHVTNVFEAKQLPIAITRSVAAGAQTVISDRSVSTLEGYQIGTGSTGEVVTVRYVTGTGPYTLTLGYPLAKAHRADDAIVSAPNIS